MLENKISTHRIPLDGGDLLLRATIMFQIERRITAQEMRQIKYSPTELIELNEDLMKRAIMCEVIDNAREQMEKNEDESLRKDSGQDIPLGR